MNNTELKEHKERLKYRKDNRVNVSLFYSFLIFISFCCLISLRVGFGIAILFFLIIDFWLIKKHVKYGTKIKEWEDE